MGYKDIPRKASANIEELTPEVKAFAQKLADKFPEDLLVTDGKRSPKAKHGSSTSHHHHGNAIDIRPNPRVYNFLMNTEEGLSWMEEAGLGLYDETDPRNMEVATGAHFHIGKDTSFSSSTRARLDKLRSDGSIPKKSYFLESNPDFDYTKFVNARGSNKEHKGEKFNFESFTEDYLGTYEGYYEGMHTEDTVTLMEESEDTEHVDHDNTHEIEELRNEVKRLVDKDIEAEKIREKKELENENLRALKQEEQVKLDTLRSMMEQDYYVERTPTSSKQNTQAPIQYNPIPETQII